MRRLPHAHMIHALWSQDQNVNLLSLGQSIKRTEAPHSVPKPSQPPTSSRKTGPGDWPSAILQSLLGEKENLDILEGS